MMAMQHGVDRILSVSLAVKDLKQSEAFYQQTWGLRHSHAHGGVAYLRGSGSDHHIVSIAQAAKPALRCIRFGAPGPESVRALHDHSRALGVRIDREPHEFEPSEGGGYGFSLFTPDEQIIEILASSAEADHGPSESVPTRLSHVVLNSADIERMTSFFMDVLGFRLSDSTEPMRFIRCSADHHSIAVARGCGASVNHIAFDMPDLDALMSGSGRLRRSGFEMQWGVGRHGPGNNIFAYFIEPNGFVVEYTTGMQQIDEATYRPQTPDYWGAFPMRPCRWGMATTPSKRIIEAFAGMEVA